VYEMSSIKVAESSLLVKILPDYFAMQPLGGPMHHQADPIDGKSAIGQLHPDGLNDTIEEANRRADIPNLTAGLRLPGCESAQTENPMLQNDFIQSKKGVF